MLKTYGGGQNPQNISQAGAEANLDVQFAFGMSFPIKVCPFERIAIFILYIILALVYLLLDGWSSTHYPAISGRQFY